MIPPVVTSFLAWLARISPPVTGGLSVSLGLLGLGFCLVGWGGGGGGGGSLWVGEWGGGLLGLGGGWGGIAGVGGGWGVGVGFF